MAQQDLHTEQLLEHANTAQRHFIEQQLNQPVVTQADQMREQAIGNAIEGIFITDTADWFATSTAKINQLHDIASYLSKELGISTEKHGNRRNSNLFSRSPYVRSFSSALGFFLTGYHGNWYNKYAHYKTALKRLNNTTT